MGTKKNEKELCLHIACTGKGGAGKSTVASILAQILWHITGQRPLVLDLDVSNPTICGVKALEALFFDVTGNDLSIIPAKFDQVIETILDSETQHIVLDIGAPTYLSFMNYMVKQDGLAVLKAEGVRVLMHMPLLGGPALDFTSNAIEATLAAGERVIVWENPRDGMPEKNGIRFADTSLARSYDASRLGIVHMPALNAELEGKDFQKMAEGFLTFAQATADDSFSRMARHRLAKLWAAYAEQADVMMGVAHV